MTLDDERRKSDKRPWAQDEKLTFLPAHGEPFRWLPRHGEPLCVGEWVTQHAVKFIAFLPVYIAIMVTVILCVQIWGPPSWPWRWF